MCWCMCSYIDVDIGKEYYIHATVLIHFPLLCSHLNQKCVQKTQTGWHIFEEKQTLWFDFSLCVCMESYCGFVCLFCFKCYALLERHWVEQVGTHFFPFLSPLTSPSSWQVISFEISDRLPYLHRLCWTANFGNEKPLSLPPEVTHTACFTWFHIVASLHLKKGKRSIYWNLDSKSGVLVLTGPLRFQNFCIYRFYQESSLSSATGLRRYSWLKPQVQSLPKGLE